MEGRRREGGRKAAAFLIEEFRRLKLEPLFDGQFVQEIPGRRARAGSRAATSGPSSAAADPKLRDEWVIVAAHYDHLGVATACSTPAPTTTPRAWP